MNENPRDPNEIGALWNRTSAKGEYMTGMVNGQRVVVFKNDRKTGDQPDWRVLKPKPKEQQTGPPRMNPLPIDEAF